MTVCERLAEWTDNTHAGFRFWADLRIISFPSSRVPSSRPLSQPLRGGWCRQPETTPAAGGVSAPKSTTRRNIAGKWLCQAAMQWEIAALSAVVWRVDRWGGVLGGRMRQPRNQQAMQDAVVWNRSGVGRSSSQVDLFRIPFLALSEAFEVRVEAGRR